MSGQQQGISRQELNVDLNQEFDELINSTDANNTLLANKVDKVTGKSLISDTEITRLAGVSNFDSTAINAAITALNSGKLDKSTYNGTAQDLYSLIINATTGVTGKSIVPTDTPTGTGVASWIAVQNGTYTNFGGLVLPVNSVGVISRSATNVYSISYTAFDFSLFTRKIQSKYKADLEVGKNKVNSLAMTDGYYMNVNGAPVVSATHSYTEKIPVIAGTQYKSNVTLIYSCYYDINENVVAGGGYNATTITPPTGAVYYIGSILTSSKATFQFEIGSVSTNYEDYYIKVKQSQLDLSSYISTKQTDNIKISQEVLTTDNFTVIKGFTQVSTGLTGVVGTSNSLKLPIKTFDPTKDFRIDVVVTVNAITDGSSLSLTIKNSVNSYFGDIKTYIEVSSGVRRNIGYFFGANANTFKNIPIGSKIQISLIGISGIITYSASLIDDWDGTINDGYLPDLNKRIVYMIKQSTDTNSGVSPFIGINTLDIAATNGNEFIINSLNVSIGSAEPTTFVNSMFALRTYNDAIDNSTNFYSYVFAKKGSKTLAQWHHPNGFGGTIYNVDLFKKLYNNGIGICFGTFNSFVNPAGTLLYGSGVTASNWGAPAGLKYRKRLMDVCKNILKTDNLISIGGSMGGLNALAYSVAYPDTINCVVSISGAIDLASNFNSGGFNAVIKKAYSSAYVCIADNTGVVVTDTTKWTKIANEKEAPLTRYYENNPFYDTYSASKAYVIGDVVFVDYTGNSTDLKPFNPMFNGLKLATVPILLIHGSADTLILPTQSTGLKTYIEGLGGNKVEYINVASGTHLSSDCFKNDEILAFINKFI